MDKETATLKPNEILSTKQQGLELKIFFKRFVAVFLSFFVWLANKDHDESNPNEPLITKQQNDLDELHPNEVLTTTQQNNELAESFGYFVSFVIIVGVVLTAIWLFVRMIHYFWMNPIFSH